MSYGDYYDGLQALPSPGEMMEEEGVYALGSYSAATREGVGGRPHSPSESVALRPALLLRDRRGEQRDPRFGNGPIDSGISAGRGGCAAGRSGVAGAQQRSQCWAPDHLEVPLRVRRHL